MALGKNQHMDLFDYPLDGVSLIEASAGTGKTWTICGLYLRLLLERQLHVEEILVVTFTNAAAAELRERIRGHIVSTLTALQRPTLDDPFVSRLVATVATKTRQTPTAMYQWLDAARHAFDEAAIFTIHGFCQRVLAETPFASGLPFGLEIIQAGDQELRLGAVRDFWRQAIAGGELTAPLIDYLIDQKDSPESWAQLLANYLAKPLAKVIWPEAPETAPTVGALAAAFEKAKSLWSAPEEAGSPTQVLLDHLTALNGNVFKASSVARGAIHWAHYLAKSNPLATLAFKEDKLHLFCAEEIKAKKQHTAPSHLFFRAAQAVRNEREALLAGLQLARLRVLRAMLTQAAQAVRAEKIRARLVSFDDMLSNVHQALTSGTCPWLPHALRGRYPVALIDEFQDTDPLQFAIFNTIYRSSAVDADQAGPLFVVGDPKQAIYSFRNADLHTYLHAKECANHRHTLRHNQRSVAPLIDALNALFGINRDAFLLPGLTYERVAEGVKPRKHLVDRTESQEGVAAALRVWSLPAGITRNAAKQHAAQATATEVARLIAAGQAGQITLEGKGLTPGQIAILVKSHAQGKLIREALAQCLVGSVTLSQESIFNTQDARELERILRAILSPGQPTVLYGALATEVMGYDATALAKIQQDEAALMAIMMQFEGYHQLWRNRSFGFMLQRWLDEAQVTQRLLQRDDGERRLTNLLHLTELLQQAATTYPVPEVLLRWFVETRADDANEVNQLRLESDRNLVQIVTIHKAKGLEYDFVFCPFLWDGYRKREDSVEGTGYHDDQGQWVIDFRPEAHADEEKKRRRAWESDAETMRLFYVALTRAVQRAYLIAGSYYCRASFSQSSRSLLNWLVAGAGLPYSQWLQNKKTPEEIAQAWRTLADGTPTLALSELPGCTGIVLSPQLTDPASLTIPAPPSNIPRGWQIGSFSSLQRVRPWQGERLGAPEGALAEQSASDHDGDSTLVMTQRLVSRTPPDESALAVDDFLFFPLGAAAGECIHALFERIDFTMPAGWEAAILSALADHPLTLTDHNTTDSEILLQRMLKRLLMDVMNAALPDGILLGKLPPSDCLVELGFVFPANQLDANALNHWLLHHGYSVGRSLTFARLQGYLRGYIDLVFRHHGKFYILDWKSNHLGFTASDYMSAPIAHAMEEHGYHLQALIYSVALHRYLSNRLVDYDFNQSFGGVLYLFVRGVRLGWEAPSDHSTSRPGVYFHQPPWEVIRSLDHLLAGR